MTVWWRLFGVGRGPRAGAAGGAEPLSVQRDTGRLVAFSDAVVAITITLLVLEIKPPSDYRHLLHGLGALWPSYLAYAITFLFIGQVWANHHVMFDHVRAADRVVLLPLLLMVVAFLRSRPPSSPARCAAGTASASPSSSTASRFDLTALTFNAVWQYARRHRLLGDASDPAGQAAVGRRFQLALIWLSVGTALGAALPVLGMIAIAGFNAYYWFPIHGEGRRAAPLPAGGGSGEGA